MNSYDNVKFVNFTVIDMLIIRQIVMFSVWHGGQNKSRHIYKKKPTMGGRGRGGNMELAKKIPSNLANEVVTTVFGGSLYCKVLDSLLY